MMNLLRRRALMIAAQVDKPIPVWDGVTVTTPALVNGYYEIYNGATLKGFDTINASNKKGKVISDFALNSGWENYETWNTTPPQNSWTLSETGTVSEFDGGGHTIYGFFSSASGSSLIPHDSGIKIHDLKVHGFCTVGPSAANHRQALCTGFFDNGTSEYGYNIEMVGKISNSNAYNNSAVFNAMLGNSTTSKSHSIMIYCTMSNNYNSYGISNSATNAGTIKNSAFVGSLATTNTGVIAGIINSLGKAVNFLNCWSSITMNKGTRYSFGYTTGSVAESYFDSTKYAAGQGIAKTTNEIKTQAYVDLLNANIDANSALTGCTKWKLETRGLLAGWPTLDF